MHLFSGRPAGRSLIACALVVALLSGCGGTLSAAQPAQQADIVVAISQGSTAQALRVAAERYQQASGQRVQVEAFDNDNYHDQVTATLLAGLDRYDLLYLPASDLAKWVRYRTLRALDLPPDQAALSPWLPLVTFEGLLYGLPTQPDPYLLWYRADLFQAAGLAAPRTWEDFDVVAHALNVPPRRYGTVIAGSEQDAGMDFSSVLAGFGGEVISPEPGQGPGGRRVTVNDENGRRALSFYAGLSSGQVTAPQAAGYTRRDVLSALREDKTVMSIAPLSAAAELLDCQASPKICQEGHSLLSWSWLPGLDEQTAIGELGVWVIPQHAAHPTAAGRLLAWLASEEGAGAWAQAGGTPAQLTVLATTPGPAAALARLQRYRLTLPPVASTEQLWPVYHAAIHAAIAGQAPEQALDEAAAQMQKVLRQEGNR